MTTKKKTTTRKTKVQKLKLNRAIVRDLDIKDRGKKVMGGVKYTYGNSGCCAVTGYPA